MIGNYYKYCLLFCLIGFFVVETKAQVPEPPELPNDYGSPTVNISESAFDLSKKWVVPTGRNGITEMGAWISPNAAGYTILTALIFEINSQALQVNYEKSLKSLIELSYQQLPKNIGQLFSFTYNYSELGSPDVTSIRFTALGLGATQEQSLAFGPIDQITQGYSENAVFSNKSTHYVWMYKKDDGSLTLSTIKEPFIDNLKKRSLELKIKMLETPTSIKIYNDTNIKIFEVAEKWSRQTFKYKQELEKQQKYKEVEVLNEELKRKQKEFKDLQKKYEDAQSQNRNLGTVIQYIDVCQSITALWNKNSSSIIQSNENAAYRFEKTNLDNYIGELTIKTKSISSDLNMIEKRLKKIFLNSNIPSPLP